ncbi:anaphase-promoting complex, subunit 10-domain-containing protein [Geopyxis carbonaria]|nr:anaphase-promoting complex, subunit 10-domain-containing protein [Geopyxis carbonaria]
MNRAVESEGVEDEGEFTEDELDDDDEGDELEDGEEDDDEEEDDNSITTAPLQAPSASLVGLKEIGNLASWTCSTAKPGNGIAQLRDLDTSQFWQSDGPQPHHINIHFAKRVKVNRVRMFLDFENDESYTPTKMVIMSGTGYHDLCEVAKLDLERPTGWIDVDLSGVHEDGELRTHLVQLRILANHQNGKDTHVRGLQVYAKEEMLSAPDDLPFSHPRMLEELEVR